MGLFDEALADSVARATTASPPPTLVVVGPCGVVAADRVSGAGDVIRPADSAVSSAVGAAIAPVTGWADRICPNRPEARDRALAARARRRGRPRDRRGSGPGLGPRRRGRGGAAHAPGRAGDPDPRARGGPERLGPEPDAEPIGRSHEVETRCQLARDPEARTCERVRGRRKIAGKRVADAGAEVRDLADEPVSGIGPRAVRARRSRGGGRSPAPRRPRAAARPHAPAGHRPSPARARAVRETPDRRRRGPARMSASGSGG